MKKHEIFGWILFFIGFFVAVAFALRMPGSPLLNKFDIKDWSKFMITLKEHKTKAQTRVYELLTEENKQILSDWEPGQPLTRGGSWLLVGGDLISTNALMNNLNEHSTPAASRVWTLLDEKTKETVTQLSSGNEPDKDQVKQIITGLNNVIMEKPGDKTQEENEDRSLYDPDLWNPEKDLGDSEKQILLEGLNKVIDSKEKLKLDYFKDLELTDDNKEKLRKALKTLNNKDKQKLNRLLLQRIFPDNLAKCHQNIRESITRNLNREIINYSGFYDSSSFSEVKLNAEARKFRDKGTKNLSKTQLKRFNRLVMEATFHGLIVRKEKPTLMQLREGVFFYIILIIGEAFIIFALYDKRKSGFKEYSNTAKKLSARANALMIVGNILAIASLVGLFVTNVLFQPWHNFFTGIFVCVAGAGLLSMPVHRKIHAHDADEKHIDPINIMEELIGKISDINYEEMSSDQIKKTLDELELAYLIPFAEHRHQFQHDYGMMKFAEFFSDFATGERNLNRAWSAIVDGYPEESKNSLDRSLLYFKECLERLTGYETDDENQKPEVGNQEPKDGNQEPEAGNQESKDG